MKRISSLSLAILIALFLVVGSERRAWGYVDPGSGLIALQTAASVVAAYLYIVRRRVRAFFHRKRPDPVVIPVSTETAQNSKAA